MVALELSCSVAPLSLSWWWCIINRWRRAARKRSKNGEAWNSESCYFRRNKQRGGWTCSVFHSVNDILVRQSFLARPVHTFLSSEMEFRWLLFRTTLMHPLHVFLMGEIELYIWPIFDPPLYGPLHGFLILLNPSGAHGTQVAQFDEVSRDLPERISKFHLFRLCKIFVFLG